MEQDINNKIDNGLLNHNKKSLTSFKKFKDSRTAISLMAIFVLIIVFFGGMVIGLNRQINFEQDNLDNPKIGQVLNTDVLPEYLSKDVNFKIFWKVWDIVKGKYIDRDKITETQLFYGALKGTVAALSDPYSVFLPPEDTKKFDEELAGKFEGIGAEIGIKNDRLTIIAPLPESPAEKANLKPLDEVMAIDDLDTTGISLDEAVKLIRGEKGTQVTLSIRRKSEDTLLKIIITREEIKVISVRFNMKDENVAYLQITNFNSDTTSVFSEKVNELLTKSPKGIILDLRNNPGGYLNGAVDIAGYWVENGQLVVKEDFNNPELNQEYLSQGRAQLKNIPTVVLVNQGSASASEIVAGALQDYKLATIVGMQTFGKGSVQELEKLSDGSSIKLTIARWLTPDGRLIDKDGINPDIEIDLTKDDYNANRDPQLEKALEIIKNPKPE